MNLTHLARAAGQRFGPYAALGGVIVGVGILATLRAPVFFTQDNLIEILRATSTYFIVACPFALLVMAGGMDFSVGATFSVGAVVACSLMTEGFAWPLAVLIGLAAGSGTGLVGGVLVVYSRVTPIVATLSVFFVATGLVNFFVEGLITPLPQGFLDMGQSDVFGVPAIVWCAVVVGIGFWTLLNKFEFGYAARAIGGNRDAAVASGIPVHRIELKLYALCGAAAALAGVLYSARTSAGQPDAGGFAVTLDVLTGVLVGGTSLSGGMGSIGGVALGCLLLGELENALGVAGFDQVLSDVFVGAILGLSVALDGYRRRREFLETSAETPEARLPTVSRRELIRVMSGESRLEAARTMDAVSTERKRIERDLHDGAQQQLVNAALMLQLATDQLNQSDYDKVMQLLNTSMDGLRTALGDLRDLSRGVYPVLLNEYGLVAAVQSLVLRHPMPIDLRADDVPRVDERVEIMAYFLVAEALTNVVKHAGATTVMIAIRHDGAQLQVSVADDGAGSADESAGTGLRGLRDRIGSVGGRLTVTSPAGAGTTLTAVLPALPRAAAPERL